MSQLKGKQRELWELDISKYAVTNSPEELYRMVRVFRDEVDAFSKGRRRVAYVDNLTGDGDKVDALVNLANGYVALDSKYLKPENRDEAISTYAHEVMHKLVAPYERKRRNVSEDEIESLTGELLDYFSGQDSGFSVAAERGYRAWEYRQLKAA